MRNSIILIFSIDYFRTLRNLEQQSVRSFSIRLQWNAVLFFLLVEKKECRHGEDALDIKVFSQGILARYKITFKLRENLCGK